MPVHFDVPWSCGRALRRRLSRVRRPATPYPWSSRLTKKSLVSVPGLLGEDAVLGIAGIRTEHAQAADQHRHFRPGQRQQLRPVHQRLHRRHELQLLAVDIVAEAVGARFERREGLHVGLLLRRVHAARREGDLHVDAGILRGLFDRGGAAEHDQVGERDFLAEAPSGSLRASQHRRELRRLVDLPVLLRSQTNARAVRAAALVGAAERRGRRPGGRDQLRTPSGRRRGSSPSARRCPWLRRSADDPRPGSGPARSALPSAPAGRDSGRAGPCRGA